MDSRVLKHFLSVTKHHSIGRAAEAVHLTQPALSKSIRRLEQELGVKLFDRTASGTAPTAFGRALIDHAQAVQLEVDRLKERMADLRDGRAGRVTIGAGPGMLEALVSRATARLCTRSPDIHVTVVAGLAEELLPALQAGEIDLVLGPATVAPLEPRLSSTRLFRDEIGIVARRQHPLRRRRGIALRDLVNEHWVLPSPGHTFTKNCAACFSAAGLAVPSPNIVANSLTFIDRIIADTEYLTFMPLSLVATWPRREAMGALKVPGGTWAREVHLFRRSYGTSSPAATALAEELQRLTKAPANIGSGHSPRTRKSEKRPFAMRKRNFHL